MTWHYLKNILIALVGLCVTLGLGIVLTRHGSLVLEAFVEPPAGVDVTDWLDGFTIAGRRVLVLSLVLTSVWHAFALFDSGRGADLRKLWLIIWALAAAIAVITASVSLPKAQSGTAMGYAFLIFLAVLSFWVATVVCTPVCHKYDPIGAFALRTRVRW